MLGKNCLKRIDSWLAGAGMLLLILQLLLLGAVLLRLNAIDQDVTAALAALMSKGKTNQLQEISEDDDPSIGSRAAKVVIVEFSDFECPYCAEAVTNIRSLQNTFSDDVRVVYRDFPLQELHTRALAAAVAAECAHEQGKFWEMHDVLFAHRTALMDTDLHEYAQRIGLDDSSFNTCLNSEVIVNEIRADQQQGLSYGVQGTPTFFINGLMVAGSVPLSTLEAYVEAALRQ